MQNHFIKAETAEGDRQQKSRKKKRRKIVRVLSIVVILATTVQWNTISLINLDSMHLFIWKIWRGVDSFCSNRAKFNTRHTVWHTLLRFHCFGVCFASRPLLKVQRSLLCYSVMRIKQTHLPAVADFVTNEKKKKWKSTKNPISKKWNWIKGDSAYSCLFNAHYTCWFSVGSHSRRYDDTTIYWVLRCW